MILDFSSLTKRLEKINVDDIANILDKSWNENHTFTNLKYTVESLSNVKYISSGSSRSVYNYMDKFAIKIAKNRKGLTQNRVENNRALQDYGIVPIIYNASDDNAYIIVELCSKCKRSDFRNIEKISFDYYCDCLEYFYYNIHPNKYVHIDKPDGYDDTWNNDGLLYKMYAYVGDFDIPIGDLTRIANYGINRDGNIVLTDSGFNNDVEKEYYRR